MINKELRKGFGAQDWNRTSTILRTADFESAASTNSATWAFSKGWQYYDIPHNLSKFLSKIFYGNFKIKNLPKFSVIVKGL